MVSGPLLVGQALYRRFITRRGTLRGPSKRAGEYGFRLADLIGQGTSPAQLASFPGRITTEALKESRIRRVDVTIAPPPPGVSVQLDITIVGYTAEGPFTLVLRASEVKVELLSLKAGTSS
jgi:hypothetical protein